MFYKKSRVCLLIMLMCSDLIKAGIKEDYIKVESSLEKIQKPLDQKMWQVREYQLAYITNADEIKNKRDTILALEEKIKKIGLQISFLEEKIKERKIKIISLKLGKLHDLEEIISLRREEKKINYYLNKINESRSLLIKTEEKINEFKSIVNHLNEFERKLVLIMDEVQKEKMSRERDYKYGKEIFKEHSFNKNAGELRKYQNFPLKDIYNYKIQNKGLLLSIKNPQELFSIKKGKVIYVGILSTFGHIVMIDYGIGETMVYLGDFKPIVKEGDMIEHQGKIGDAVPGENKIYIEIRKNNMAVNTQEWIKENNIF